MNKNKAAALEKLREKQTDGLLTNFGESWLFIRRLLFQ
jgi:hypothetical protein